MWNFHDRFPLGFGPKNKKRGQWPRFFNYPLFSVWQIRREIVPSFQIYIYRAVRNLAQNRLWKGLDKNFPQEKGDSPAVVTRNLQPGAPRPGSRPPRFPCPKWS